MTAETVASEKEIVPPGYKRTEVGVIPEEWKALPLSELLDFRNGVNADKDAYGKGTPFINVLEVITNTHLREKDVPGLVSLPNALVESFAVRRGDVLFNRTSETQEEVGLAAVYLGDEKVVFGGFVIRGQKREATVDDVYAGYAFRSPSIRSQIVAKGQGAVRANIGQQELRKVLATLPPLPEQRAIAAALSDVDDLISSLDALIEKKWDMKTAAMQRLLTGEQRLPGFDGEWETKRIGDFTECTAGGTPSTEVNGYWGGSIKWMSSGELNLRTVHDVKGRITQKGLTESSAKLVPPNCILVGLAGQGKTRGTVATNTVELCTNQSIGAIYPNHLFNSAYLMHNLDSRYDELRGLSTGDGGRGGLNLTIIRNIVVPFPTKVEQTAIAAILSDMDAEISALRERREKTKLVKQGMMQELLTGRTRLV